jgi:L-fucono-1,5-lactonase
MRLDSHQHFWLYNERDYVWMTSEMDVLRRDFTPDDLSPLLKAIDFDGSVAVQARQMVAETDWLLQLAERRAFIHGVVGWLDFESNQLDEQLERYASHPKLKGVRELIHDMADVEYATSTTHVRAIAKLARYELTYDLLLKPLHIRPAIELVHSFPNQLFVVDHIAKPDIAQGTSTQWSAEMRELASFENVYCKLSGMVTEAAWGQWKPGDFRSYLDTMLEAFGAERLMIGSDWPVCTLMGSYEDVMRIVIDYVGDLSEHEREEILGGACAQFYGLTEVPTTVSTCDFP